MPPTLDAAHRESVLELGTQPPPTGGTAPRIRQNDTGQQDGVQDARLDVLGPLPWETDRPTICHLGLRLCGEEAQRNS